MNELKEKTGVESRVIKTELINWRDLRFIQNDDFKELPEEARHKLKASIMSNNFTQPFYVWEDGSGVMFCLDGKHRTLLLEELIKEGFDVPYELPATFIDCKNRKEAAKLVLIYSSTYAKITQTGMFDFMNLNDLVFEEFKNEIDFPDFSMPRFEQKFNPMGVDFAPDDAVPIPENGKVIVSYGDIFQLGPHRLACGDFKDFSLIDALMADDLARIVFTDPPYNLKTNEFLNLGEHKHEDFVEAAGEMDDEEFKAFLATVMSVSKRKSLPGSIHYICMDWRHMWHMTEAARLVYESPIPKQLVVWNKNQGANGSFYRSKHEMVFIFKNGEEKHVSNIDLKDRTRYNVWDYPSGSAFNNPDRDQMENHPTPKPVAMVADAILDSTNEGDVVCDWFMGSGTTIIASEITGRKCRGVEIMPKFVQSSIVRYLQYCQSESKDPQLVHLNGNLTESDFS
ncbi:MAG: site-specific DNA-methyltransferase [Bacteroidota bacterium]|nr:site-specific DNA-methyltransferase [Bacteroidota bacterium]